MEKLYGDRTGGFHGYSHLTGGFEGGQAEYARVPFGGFPDCPPDQSGEHFSLILACDVNCTDCASH